MQLSANEVIGIILTLAIILNTISRWTGKHDSVNDSVAKELIRLANSYKELRDELNEAPYNFLIKSDFHDEIARIWKAIDRKVEK